MKADCRKFELLAKHAIQSWDELDKPSCSAYVAELVRKIQAEKRCIQPLIEVVMHCGWAYPTSNFDRVDREDIANSVYEKLTLDKILTFRGDSNFSTWLYHIVRTTAIDLYNKESKEAYPEDLAPEQGAISEGQSSLMSDRVDAISNLTADEYLLYTTWRKYEFRDRVAPQIANELGWNSRTIQLHIANLKKKLANEMVDPKRGRGDQPEPG